MTGAIGLGTIESAPHARGCSLNPGRPFHDDRVGPAPAGMLRT
nr:hypothetical protein [Streptomyces albidoflavus]